MSSIQGRKYQRPDAAKTEQKSDAAKAEASADETPPPYEPELLRLSEILGALADLRDMRHSPSFRTGPTLRRSQQMALHS